MKKITAVIGILILICIVFSSCVGSGYALSVDNKKVDSEVYAYYLDRAVCENKDLSFDEQKVTALNMCAEYVAINNKYNELDLSVSTKRKDEISKNVNALWRLYYRYYEKIGVSKQTLVKIYENEAYKITILLAYYDTGGVTPISEEDIKAHFSSNYTVFKSINDYLTAVDENGEYAPLQGEALTAKQSAFKNMADKISGDTTIDTVYSEYMSEQGQTAVNEIPVSVISKSSKNYPSGFFDKVKSIAENDADSVTLGSYIFCVQRLNSFGENNQYYNLYREDCLISLVISDFEETVLKWVSNIPIRENSIRIKQISKTVAKVREEYNSDKTPPVS